MSEKRRQRRDKRRLAVKFGEDTLTSSGYTVDISTGGAFIVAPKLVPIGTRLHLQIFARANQYYFFEARVRRQKVVPPSMHVLAQGGFGVGFLTPEEIVSEALSGECRLELRYSSLQQLKDAWARELRMGGAFIVTAKSPARDTQVQVGIELDFVPRSWEVRATVVHVTQGSVGSAVRGVAVVFDDRQAFESLLMPFVA
jgi:Tfp pilus assembly protein PilZ